MTEHVPHGLAATATGRQLDIAGHGYHATITEFGATLRRLTHAGRDLISGFDADQPMPLFNGALLGPWPNRIDGGAYDFDGKHHQLPISEPARHAALHGLVAWQTWSITDHQPAAVELRTVIHPQRGYPFLLALTARYSIDSGGLTIRVGARNDGPNPAPYGVSMHPWFVADDESIAGWTMRLPAATILTTDDRLIPNGAIAVAGSHDYRGPGRLLSETELDHAFTDIMFRDGAATAQLIAADGHGVELSWGPECQWVQVCTGDRSGVAALDRRAVAIEPMTCAPNAFRSGRGLIRLNPNVTGNVRWRIASIDPP